MHAKRLVEGISTFIKVLQSLEDSNATCARALEMSVAAIESDLMLVAMVLIVYWIFHLVNLLWSTWMVIGVDAIYG